MNQFLIIVTCKSTMEELILLELTNSNATCEFATKLRFQQVCYI